MVLIMVETYVNLALKPVFTVLYDLYIFIDFQSLRSISWHHEGKQFMSSHTDGSLITWNVKSQGKPASIIIPHGKLVPMGCICLFSLGSFLYFFY